MIDSGGVDEHGLTKALYGNPQTGPFYVGGAESGDVLAVHIKRLRLNRDYADSLDAIAERVKDSRLAVQAKDLGQRVRWKLDLRKGIAKPDVPTEHLKDFTVPLKPMLGCVGVAPDFGFAPFSTGEQGRYGGNMDFNEITEIRRFILTSLSQERCCTLATARRDGRRRNNGMGVGDINGCRVLGGCDQAQFHCDSASRNSYSLCRHWDRRFS
jgi:hypothetical protein